MKPTSTRPNKALGQHWLKDAATLSSIVRSGHVSKDDVVLEVGPGLGTLTNHLAQAAHKVIAVEYDAMLAANLPQRTPENVEVVHQDILSFDFDHLPHDYKVIANIPYYLTSHLVRRLLEANNQPARIVLLVQKEVAERITAQPGDMSVLSVTSQYYAECQLGEVVPAELFEPPPKVDSQVVILEPKQETGPSSKELFRVVKAGFGERRKKLANSLAGGLHLDKSEVEAVIAAIGLDKNVRAQELSLDQWHTLTERLSP